MAHDLRQPLSVVMGMAMLLETHWDELSEDEKRANVALIARSSHWMKSLIEDLVVSGAAEDGAVPRNTVPFAVPDMVMATIGDMAPKFRDRVSVYVKDSLPDGLGDPVKQRKVLQNLLDNAIKYSGPGSPVDVGISERANTLAVTVADHGLGIAIEDMPTIFDKYIRVDGEEEAVRIEGNGLGLYVCKAMVNAAGGEIGVESNTGSVGSIFTFTLPIAR